MKRFMVDKNTVLLLLKGITVPVPEIKPVGTRSYSHVWLTDFSRHLGETHLLAQLCGLLDNHGNAISVGVCVDEHELFIADTRDKQTALIKEKVNNAAKVLRGHLLEN